MTPQVHGDNAFVSCGIGCANDWSLEGYVTKGFCHLFHKICPGFGVTGVARHSGLGCLGSRVDGEGLGLHEYILQ